MTRVVLGIARVRKMVFREHCGSDARLAYAAQGSEVQLRLQLRYEMQFRNEPCLTDTQRIVLNK